MAKSTPSIKNDRKISKSSSSSTSKRNSSIGFVNPLAALDEVEVKTIDHRSQSQQQFPKSLDETMDQEKSLTGRSFEQKKGQTDKVGEDSIRNSEAAAKSKSRKQKRSSLVGFVNPLASGISITTDKKTFSSPSSHSPKNVLSPKGYNRRSMAVSSEKAEAMKFARSINVFVGPEDAMLLKKCMHDGKASFDAELMEKSEQVGVNVDVSADRIIINSKTKSKKAKPKLSKRFFTRI